MILRFLLVFVLVVNNLIVSCDIISAAEISNSSIGGVLENHMTSRNRDSPTTNEEKNYSTQNLEDSITSKYSPSTISSSTAAQQNFVNVEEYDPTNLSHEMFSTTGITTELKTNEKENITEYGTKDISESFTTLLNLEEDHNMSFNRLAEIFAVENNLEKKRRRKEEVQQKMDVFIELQDDITKSEFVKQEIKYQSLGIEPLALIITPEGTRSSLEETPTNRNWSERTSFLLISDTELDTGPFDVKSKSAKQLELQEEENVINVTHMAEFLRNSQESTLYVLPPLTVEVSEDTNLLMNPNERHEILFEVTNNLNNAARVTFSVRDELGILLDIDRYIVVLEPHASTSVRVTVLPRTGQSSDRITFIATGSEQVRKEVIVDIEKDFRSDSDSPLVDYTYTSDCTDVLLSKCREGTWTIRIAARDSESGLKVLTTIPKGLYIPDGYSAGTREEVIGIYSESCCKADLQIIAIDRMNNRYVRQINAYRAPLSFWAVTAIVLVGLIFLAIIIASSLICLKKCKKKESDSFDLPTYRGGRSRY